MTQDLVTSPRSGGLDGGAPRHVLLGDDRHGVTAYAAQLAAACGAAVVRDLDLVGPGDGPTHLHVTDRLLGSTPAAAAAAVERLARTVPLTLTLHDVPQPTDGPVFAARADAYGRMVRAARAWVTNSEHEQALVRRWCDAEASGVVLPLPVTGVPDLRHRPRLDTEPVVGVFGYIYPGKGHRQVVRAVAALRRVGVPARVLAIGDPASGHPHEIGDLAALADTRAVPLEVTGRVGEAEVDDVLRSVAVPVVAHRNVSASGSLNSWLRAGRRPLLRDGVYAREMAALRLGTATLFTDDRLADAILAAWRRPASTWLDPAVDLRPHLDDSARGYLQWWRTLPDER